MKQICLAGKRIALAAVMLTLASCTASRTAMVARGEVATTPPPSAGMPAPPVAAAQAPHLPMPPTRLVARPEGTPLPPRDPSIAHGWPSDLKQLIDNMIALYPKDPYDKAPNVEEVEQKMGITLTERPLEPGERSFLSRRYVVSGTRYVDPTTPELFRAFYWISKGDNSLAQKTQTLQLEVAPKQSGFCLNPYELAVYTGWSFENFDTSPHANVRYWPPAYVWGMFSWSNIGRYGGPGYSVVVGIEKDVETLRIVRIGCVQSITVTGRYPKEY